MDAQFSKECDAELARLRRVVLENPRSEAFAALAEKLCALGQIDEAEQICRKGLVFVPGSLDGRLALARVLLMRGRLDEAQAALIEVIDVDAEHPEALRRLGQVVLRRGDKARARAILEYAELLLPGDGGVADLLVQAGGMPAFHAQRTPSGLGRNPGGPTGPAIGGKEREPRTTDVNEAALTDDPTMISPIRVDDLMLSQQATPAPGPAPSGPASRLAPPAEHTEQGTRVPPVQRDVQPAPSAGPLHTTRLAELAQSGPRGRSWKLFVGVLVLAVVLWFALLR